MGDSPNGPTAAHDAFEQHGDRPGPTATPELLAALRQELEALRLRVGALEASLGRRSESGSSEPGAIDSGLSGRAGSTVRWPAPPPPPPPPPPPGMLTATPATAQTIPTPKPPRSFENEPPVALDHAAPAPEGAENPLAARFDPSRAATGSAPSMPTQPSGEHARLTAWTPTTRTPMELVVGGRWAAWVGALVVVLGAGFFLKHAYDEGWLGGMPPALRCAFAAGFGVALLLAGEVLLRRVSRAAAVGLFAAGLGTLYLTVLVAYRGFALVGDLGAFALLAATAAVGVLATLRARTLVVGVLSLLAGYAAPLMVHGGSTVPVALPLYLTMLLAVVLALSSFVPRPFRALRLAGLPMHGIVAGLWVLVGDVTMVLGTVFLAVWWAMVFVEGLLAARRGQSRYANAAVLLATSGWVATCLAIGFDGAMVDSGWAGVVVAVLAVAGVGLVCTYDGDFAALRGRPRSAMELFSVATWLQGGVLVAAAAAIQLSASGATVAWFATAVAAVEFGRRIRSGASTLFGLLLAVLASGKLLLVDWHFGAAQRSVLAAPTIGVDATFWVLLAFAGAAALAIAALRMRVEFDEDDRLVPWLSARLRARLAVFLCGMSVTVTLCAIEAMGRGVVVPVLWLALAATLLGLHAASVGAAQRLRLLELGVAVFIAALARWLGGDAWEAAGLPRGRPWLTWHLALAAPMAAVAIWIDRLLNSRRALRVEQGAPLTGWREALAQLAVALPVVSVLGAVSIELLRAVRSAGGFASVLSPMLLWWCVIWGVGGAAIARLGRARSAPASTLLGLVVSFGVLLAWTLLGALADRLAGGVAAVPPLMNLQALAGAAAIAGGAASAWCAAHGRPPFAHAAWATLALAVGAGLLLGSLEVERLVPPGTGRLAAAPFMSPAVSVWWGLFGAGLIVLGFARRIPLARYAGLALLGITVAKFILLDLHGAGTLWRVAALIVVGLLLVATSVLYVRVGAKVVGGPSRPA